jgi:hypothetical protein
MSFNACSQVSFRCEAGVGFVVGLCPSRNPGVPESRSDVSRNDAVRERLEVIDDSFWLGRAQMETDDEWCAARTAEGVGGAIGCA